MRELSEQDLQLTQEERDLRDNGKVYQSMSVDDLIAVLQWQKTLGRGHWRVGIGTLKGSDEETGVSTHVRSEAQSLNIRYYDGS